MNLLKFGALPTEALRATVGGEGAAAVEAVASASSPAGRLVHAHEVARFIAVLAGPEGRWFNGATIDMTGGETQALYDRAVRLRLNES